jgi:hypothetical protein
LITLTAHALNEENQPILSNSHTNLEGLGRLINERLTLNFSLKPKEQSNCSTIQCNEEAGLQRLNTDTIKACGYPKLNRTLKKKEDSVEVGNDDEHQRAKDYLTQERKEFLNNDKNDGIQTFLQGLTNRLH